MNDKHNDLDHRPAHSFTDMGTEAVTLVPVVAEADGKLVDEAHHGDHVSEGEVVAYVQTDEDA